MKNTSLSIRVLEKDPQYFGYCLSMARLNIFNISNHLSKEFEISKHNDNWRLKEETMITNCFLTNKNLTK